MKLAPPNVTYGADPEGFFQKGASIIGAERIINDRSVNNVVLDGVQFELHPVPAYNIRSVGDSIKAALFGLQAHLTTFSGVSCCFQGIVDVTEEELETLSPASKALGCQPSKNVYGLKSVMPNGSTYRKRSAGGHIHLGAVFASEQHRQRLIPLMDIFVGNTSVMLDRDPGAIERRRSYGLAGEYRAQRHGVEYRTLSNFWLRGYPLMSLVFSLSGFAAAVYFNGIVATSTIEYELLRYVNIDHIIKAIQTNDAALAASNFARLQPFLNEYLPDNGFALNPSNLNDFVKFVELVNKQQGLDTLFPLDSVIEAWQKPVEFPAYLDKLKQTNVI